MLSRVFWLLVLAGPTLSCGRVGVELLPGDHEAGMLAPDLEVGPPLDPPDGPPQEDAEVEPAPSLDSGHADEQPTTPAPADGGPAPDAGASMDASSATDAAPGGDAASTPDGAVPPEDASAGPDAGVPTDASTDGAPQPDAAPPPCGGAWVRDLCWYFGALNNSCQQVCSNRGGYDSRTVSVVGTTAQGGSLEACNEILAALGQSGTAMPARRSDDKGYGCHLWGSDLWWIENTPAFTPNVAGTSVRIACACLQ